MQIVFKFENYVIHLIGPQQNFDQYLTTIGPTLRYL